MNERLKYGLLSSSSWRLETASAPPDVLHAGGRVTLSQADTQAPDEGWGTFEVDTGAARQPGLGLVLGHFDSKGWQFAHTESGALGTGLDALDLSGVVADPQATVRPSALKAEGNDVWVEAEVNLPPQGTGKVVARYELSNRAEPASGRIVNSWCTLPVANSCEEALGSAAVPDTIFQTGSGPLALAIGKGAVDVFSHGDWTSVTAPGYSPPDEPGEGATDLFSSPTNGWLAGETALGHWSSGTGEQGTSATRHHGRCPIAHR